MDWIETKIYTTHEGIEPVTGVLLGIGVSGIVVEDSQDFSDFLEAETPYWDYVDESLDYLRECETNLTVYLPDNAQGSEMYTLISQEMDRMRREDAPGAYGRLAVSTQNVNEEDWANNWKQYFKPIPVGKGLVIKPTWEELPLQLAEGRKVLEIDPSASFGTGTHYTTRLCLELLEEVVRGGEEVLDMGCGSGILGIAAALLGAKGVTAVDIDENSVRIARENFAQNRVLDRVQTFCGDVNRSGSLREKVCAWQYEIVCANIVADVIIAMLGTLKACMKPHGALLLSGIIAPREEDVQQALAREGLHVQRRLEDSDWIALLVRL